MTNIAFCGLGMMGAPMASRLLDGGHDLAVWNRTHDKTEPLVARGARSSATPADAAGGADVAITMLTGPDALEAVLFGSAGLVTGLDRGSMLIDMSTVGPAAVRGVAERLPEGIALLDAPVLGSIPQAESGELKVFAGGTAEELKRARPLLELLGEVRHVGPSGAGAAMKLVVNSTLGAVMTALGEALSLGDALGLKEGQVLDVLAESPVGVAVGRKRRLIESGSYPPTFKLSLARKDLDLVNQAAAEPNLRLRVAQAAGSWLGEAEGDGLQDLDYSAVVAHIRGRPADP
jgi:3-hydroxyisobutyrate dehydrogenase-like beta-hydroxyacid dehydrogenase